MIKLNGETVQSPLKTIHVCLTLTYYKFPFSIVKFLLVKPQLASQMNYINRQATETHKVSVLVFYLDRNNHLKVAFVFM